VRLFPSARLLKGKSSSTIARRPVSVFLRVESWRRAENIAAAPQYSRRRGLPGVNNLMKWRTKKRGALPFC
jgi:hypothetical protein